MKRIYQYRNLPCSIREDKDLWMVGGVDRVDNSGGVLEWCYDEQDALRRMAMMHKSGEFHSLNCNPWQPIEKKAG